MNFIRAQRFLAIYLLLVSVLGMTLVFLVTYKFGPGISTDGARYLSTADSLIKGKGFYDYLNLPLTQFPPLYSILIAGTSLITGIDIFPASQYLNILTFGLVIWLAGYFFNRVFPNEILFAYIGSAIFATSLSLIIMASNVLSDLLFLAFTLAFLILATDVLETRTGKSIVLMGLVAAISPFQRYAGLALLFTGAFLIFFLSRKNFLRGVFYAGLFCMLTGLPILLWVFFHNYLRTGILFGVRLPPVYLGNFVVTLEKAEHWFLPATLTNLIPSWIILLVIVLVLFTGNRIADWKRWTHRLVSPSFLPSAIFFLLYLLVLVFNVSYWEVRYPYMDRIHIIILPALLALMFLTIRELTPFYLRRFSPQKLQAISIIIFVIWLSFPIHNVQKYMRKAFYQGDVSEFNMYNIPVLRNSGIKEYLSARPAVDNQKLYSNYEAAAWFLARHTITKLPFGDVNEKRVDAAKVLQEFPTWPGKDGHGYVIWFKALSFKPYVLKPEQLTERADFQLLYSNEGGDIYLLTPK
ncbi:MAG TPA: hypothetical protein VK909_22355 [Anaerolineales bacterium]|nr:hypothetical protein [Anaerolineales bacterium]